MLIPGFLISIITFPGVIIHELAHAIFCKLMRIPIYDIKYFQFKNPVGYVMHEPTDKPIKSLLISVGPFLINTILGILIMMPVSISLIKFKEQGNLVNIFLGWIGISILMHAFPSIGDAESLKQSVIKNDEVSLIFKIITFPIIGLIYIGALGSMVWLDLFYAVIVSMISSNLIIYFM